MPNNLSRLLFSVLLLFSIHLSAQDFSKVDAHARATSFPKNQDIQHLADALSKEWTTEKEKARAIFVWITDNIRYDVKTFENKNDLEPAEKAAMQAPAQVLRSKKAVCAGYANLFGALCEASGIETIRVTGITKNKKGRIPRTGHAWNLVRADGQWALIDATWGAGDVDTDEGRYHERFKEEFFCAPPEVLILDHYPEDPLFQLLPMPLTLEEFKQDRAAVQKILSDRSKGTNQVGNSMKDSLDAYVQLDSIARYFNSCLRTLRFNPASHSGLYGLATLQYNQAITMFEKAANEVNKTSRSQDKNLMAQSLERGAAQLTTVEATLKNCILTIEKITGASEYFKPSRQLLSSARKTLSECNKNKENMEKICAQLKGRN